MPICKYWQGELNKWRNNDQLENYQLLTKDAEKLSAQIKVAEELPTRHRGRQVPIRSSPKTPENSQVLTNDNAF
jgi:hypothetical protein